MTSRYSVSYKINPFCALHSRQIIISGWRGWLWWELGHLFCVPDTDDVKQKNNSLETIPSRFSLSRKQRSLLLYVICIQHTKVLSWILESINTWTNCQFIWSGKVYIWLSVWEFKKLCLWQPCLNKLMHVENWETDQLQHDLYVDISYKFTLAWVFVSHACTQITVNTFTNDLVLFTGIIRC